MSAPAASIARARSGEPRIKPEACVIDGHLAVFIGGAYKLLPLKAADEFVRKLQGELAKLRRQEKRRLRALREAAS